MTKWIPCHHGKAHPLISHLPSLCCELQRKPRIFTNRSTWTF